MNFIYTASQETFFIYRNDGAGVGSNYPLPLSEVSSGRGRVYQLHPAIRSIGTGSDSTHSQGVGEGWGLL